MDYTYLSTLSNDQRSKGFDKKRQSLPSNKCNPSSKVASSAVQQFLARKQQEERQKYEEFRKRKEELLSLRSQNSKNNKKAKLMASRTRDNDFSKIRLTEEEEEAKASREKELQRKGLCNKVDRMKARIELEERDSLLPRKRKRKSHVSNNEEPPSEVGTADAFVKVNNSGICRKNEVEKKTLKHKPKPAPVIDYKDLLQVAAKKQFQPIPVPDEDFEEGSDEYEEEDGAHPTEELPNKNLEHYNSLKESRKQHDALDKTKRVEKERLDNKLLHVHKSKQNKENTYRNHKHNSNNLLHKPSGERDKNVHDNDLSDISLPPSGSLRNGSNCVDSHAKDNYTTYSRETHASKKMSHKSKHRCDKDNNSADRNTSTSGHDINLYKPSNVIKEQRKTPEVPSQDKTKSQNASGQLCSSENSYCDRLVQKRKHEETFRNSIKGLPDRRSNHQYPGYNEHDQKVLTSVPKQHLKKGGEKTSEFRNTHSDPMGHRKAESSHSFRIPKKTNNKAKSPDEDTPCYYTDEASSTLEDTKQSGADKTASTKASTNSVLKSDKNFSEEKLKKVMGQVSYGDRTSKSHTRFNHANELVTKNKHVNETLSHKHLAETKHAISRHSDGKLKEKSSHSGGPEKNLLNRSDKIYNSNEYFTKEGQTRAHHKSAVERSSSKSKLKDRSESALSSEVTQYFTEEFTVSESKERTGDLKHNSSKKNLNCDKETSKTKDKHHSTTKAPGHSSQTANDIKSRKYEKSKVQESQYFTENFIADEKNTMNANNKYDKRNATLQREKQSKHSQYFTENIATDRNNVEKSGKSSYNRRATSRQEEANVKQSQYFTESFERDIASKDSESICKYDKRSAAPQKESQYFTEYFESDRTKSNERSCKYDKRTSLPPKERKVNDEPQYFTEHYTTKKNETKGGNTDCKSDKRTMASKKENQTKEGHYFTEYFTTGENKIRSKDSNSELNKRTSLLQKEKQRDHSQYFTEKSVTDESNKTKRNDLTSKYDRRITGSSKEKQTKPAQYFTESFTSGGYHHHTKAGRNQNYKHARNDTTAETEKAKRNQSSSKVEEYVPMKIANNTEEYTPGEVTCEVEEYIPTKITNKIEEYVPRKIINKENLPKRASGTLYNSSDFHSGKHQKASRNDHIHSYKSEEVRRIPKRPRDLSEEIEVHPRKVCNYESTGSNKADKTNLKKDKPIANHSAEKSGSSTNRLNTQSEMNKQPTETKRLKETINEKTSGEIHPSKISNNERKVNQKEKSTSNFNNKLNGSCRRVSKSDLFLHKKPEGKPLSEKLYNTKKLFPPNDGSLLKNTLPPKDRKVIPASSMAQIMNKKFLQSKSSVETTSVRNQNFETAKSKERKSSVDAKMAFHQTKSDASPFSKEKAGPVKDAPSKQLHTDLKPVTSHHQKVNLSSQKTERKADFEYRKKHVEDARRNPATKPAFNQNRKVRQEEYENKVRNRYSRPSPRMFIKRNMDSDDEEEDEDEDDDDMSDFIDDGPIEEDEEDYSHYIREIFGYDKRRYRNEDDFDDRDMETSYAQQMKEERRSARIGYLEDLEDMRKEEEEKKKKAKVKK